MAVHRIEILGVPVDICPREELESEILKILEKPGTKQIIFLNIWGLLKARHKNDFSECIKNADLILPVSKSILKGAKFLKKQIPVRYNQFTTIIQILTTLDSHFKTLYLLGGRQENLTIAERNVHDTFPNLRIIGRCVGYYQKSWEERIIESLYKSSPSLALISEGFAEKELWAYRRRNQFSSSIFIYYKDVIGIFSKRIKRTDEKVFEKGHEIYHEVVRNPLKIFLIFPFIKYKILLLWYRLFKKNK